MKVLVFGSANIDKTYSVDHFVGTGETISAEKMELFCGGKGFNQAIAFARAGSETFFAGAIGEDGGFLRDMLHENGVNVRFLKKVPGPSGHAVIQVARDGRNCIMILAGANGMITPQYAEEVLDLKKCILFVRRGEQVRHFYNDRGQVPNSIAKAKAHNKTGGAAAPPVYFFLPILRRDQSFPARFFLFVRTPFASTQSAHTGPRAPKERIAPV